MHIGYDTIHSWAWNQSLSSNYVPWFSLVQVFNESSKITNYDICTLKAM